MLEGAFVFLLGGVVFSTITVLYYRIATPDEPPKEKPYEKYKNKDGLYSRKAVKESG